jgi:hypothetical protein
VRGLHTRYNKPRLATVCAHGAGTNLTPHRYVNILFFHRAHSKTTLIQTKNLFDRKTKQCVHIPCWYVKTLVTTQHVWTQRSLKKLVFISIGYKTHYTRWVPKICAVQMTGTQETGGLTPFWKKIPVLRPEDDLLECETLSCKGAPHPVGIQTPSTRERREESKREVRWQGWQRVPRRRRAWGKGIGRWRTRRAWCQGIMGRQVSGGSSGKATKAAAGSPRRLTGGNLADVASLMGAGTRNQHNVGGKDS